MVQIITVLTCLLFMVLCIQFELISKSFWRIVMKQLALDFFETIIYMLFGSLICALIAYTTDFEPYLPLVCFGLSIGILLYSWGESWSVDFLNIAFASMFLFAAINANATDSQHVVAQWVLVSGLGVVINVMFSFVRMAVSIFESRVGKLAEL